MSVLSISVVLRLLRPLPPFFASVPTRLHPSLPHCTVSLSYPHPDHPLQDTVHGGGSQMQPLPMPPTVYLMLLFRVGLSLKRVLAEL